MQVRPSFAHMVAVATPCMPMPVSAMSRRFPMRCWMVMRRRLACCGDVLRAAICHPAGGGNEAADLVDILLARRALDAGGYIHSRRGGDAQRLDNVVGVEPAREHIRQDNIDMFK